MVFFKDIILRADIDFFQDILGRSTFKLIRLLYEHSLKFEKLVEISLSIYPPEILLKKEHTRKSIIELLTIDEAINLAKLLNADYVDPYNSINKFRKGSNKERTLYNFFNLEPIPLPQLPKASSEETITPSYVLFDYQREVCQKVNHALNGVIPRCILHMPTGSGKTRTAMNIITDELRGVDTKLVIWLSNTNELCQQSFDEFNKAWFSLGDKEINSYKCWGRFTIDAKEVENGFVVASYQKLTNIYTSNVNDFLKMITNLSLLVIDEAHQSIAPTYKSLIETLTKDNHTKILGLTATPGRSFLNLEEDFKLSHFFSKKKVVLTIPGYDNPVKYLEDEGYIAKSSFESLEYENGLELSDHDKLLLNRSLDVSDHILKRLADHEYRTLAIINKVIQLINGGHKKIIIFATSIKHSDQISAILNSKDIVSFSITSKTHRAVRSENIRRYKESKEVCVLCNYGVLTTGFDAPKTSAAIIARPTKSLVLYSQMVGRAIRGVKAGGNEFAEIYTTVDINLPGFDCVDRAFRHWDDVYTKEGE